MSSRIVTLHYNPGKYQDYLEMSSGNSSSLDPSQFSSQEGPTSLSNYRNRMFTGIRRSEDPESADENYNSLTLKRSQSRSSVTSWMTDSEEIAATRNSFRNDIRGLLDGHNGENGEIGMSRGQNAQKTMGNGLVPQFGSPQGHAGKSSDMAPVNGKTTEISEMTKKSTEVSLRAMSDFKNRYSTREPIQALEEEWWSDVRNVSDRLHFLKESYKAIQSLKQKKLQRKTEPKEKSQLHSESPLHSGSFAITGSEDEILLSNQNIQQNSTQEDPYSSSNSNTDTPAPSDSIYLHK